MRKFVIAGLLYFLCGAGGVFGLDAEQIEALVKKPHSRENLVEELKIYPEAREYSIQVLVKIPGKENHRSPKMIVTEKTVEGKYIVSRFVIPGASEPLTMVVGYDTKAGAYRKWILWEGNVSAEVGVALPMTRAISWASTEEKDGVRAVSMEMHDAGGTSWSTVKYKGDEVVSTESGRARKTK